MAKNIEKIRKEVEQMSLEEIEQLMELDQIVAGPLPLSIERSLTEEEIQGYQMWYEEELREKLINWLMEDEEK